MNKETSYPDMLRAIRTVLNGKVWLSPEIEDRILSRVGSGADLAQSPIETLTDRELQVFELIGSGRTTHQIAVQLHLSPKTVESHKETLKRKLNLRNATELTRHGIQWVLSEQHAYQSGVLVNI